MPVFTVWFYSVNVKFGFCVIVPSLFEYTYQKHSNYNVPAKFTEKVLDI